jgi:hypothetical protein
MGSDLKSESPETPFLSDELTSTVCDPIRCLEDRVGRESNIARMSLPAYRRRASPRPKMAGLQPLRQNRCAIVDQRLIWNFAESVLIR